MDENEFIRDEVLRKLMSCPIVARAGPRGYPLQHCIRVYICPKGCCNNCEKESNCGSMCMRAIMVTGRGI